MFAPMPELIFTADIECYPELRGLFSNTQGVWRLFKTLRRLRVSNLHSLLLIRKYGLKQGRRLIMRELEMRSNSEFQKHLQEALLALRSKLGST